MELAQASAVWHLERSKHEGHKLYRNVAEGLWDMPGNLKNLASSRTAEQRSAGGNVSLWSALRALR